MIYVVCFSNNENDDLDPVALLINTEELTSDQLTILLGGGGNPDDTELQAAFDAATVHPPMHVDDILDFYWYDACPMSDELVTNELSE